MIAIEYDTDGLMLPEVAVAACIVREVEVDGNIKAFIDMIKLRMFPVTLGD